MATTGDRDQANPNGEGPFVDAPLDSRPASESAAGVVHDIPAQEGVVISTLGLLFLSLVFGNATLFGLHWLLTLLRSHSPTRTPYVDVMPEIVSFLCFAASFVALGWRCAVVSRQRARAIAAEADSLQLLVRLRKPRAFRGLWGALVDPGYLARQLVASGHFGYTFRSVRSGNAPSIVPFDARFEPLPVDETHTTVRAMLSATSLRASSDEAVDGESPRAGALSKEVELQGAAAVVRRGWRRTTNPWLIALIGWVLVLLGVSQSRSGTPTPEFVSMSLICVVIVLWVIYGHKSINDVFVAPGGLVDFGQRRYLRTQKPHLFLCSQSVLLASRTPGSKARTIVVADREQSTQFVCTALEEEFLLRAWTSPVPPPTEELVAGMAE